jgi:hypothetical protein
MNVRFCILPLVLVFSLLISAAEAPAVVSNVKVLSDKVEDLSSLEDWQKSVIKDGMTDEQKALAIFDTVVKFRHFEPEPIEFMGLASVAVTDPMKLFNVYGYGSGSAPLMALARSMKFEARAWTANRWGQAPEIQYDNAWHYLDPSLISYYRKPDGKIAGVEELAASAKAWYEKNPGYIGDVPKIQKFMREQNGIASGPELLRNSPVLEKNGNFPFNYFGWYTSMLIFDGTNKTPFPYEDVYTTGYRVNIQLRKGERLTRNWSNTGLHVNMDGAGGTPELLKAETGKGPLYYTPKMGDLTNGRVGNGTLEYAPPLADSTFKDTLLTSENITFAADKDKPVQVKDGEKSGSFSLEMPCSYVYLGGTLIVDAALAAGGDVTVAFSENNGLDWKEVSKVSAAGPQTIDLKPLVYRHYEYRLKFTLNGVGTALKSLKISHDIQHSQRPLPALGKGDNTITFSAGPQEGTITANATAPEYKGKQTTLEDYHATATGFNPDSLKQWKTLVPAGPEGDLTFPIETPGDLVRLRFGCHYRAGDKNEGIELQVSFDEGKTFKTIDRAWGPMRFNGKFITLSEIPAGTRKAQVRFAAKSRGNVVIFGARVDADYAMPHGGFRPVKVTYTWTENGQEKQDVHIAAKENETYTIKCAESPKMKAIVLELAD